VAEPVRSTQRAIVRGPMPGSMVNPTQAATSSSPGGPADPGGEVPKFNL